MVLFLPGHLRILLCTLKTEQILNCLVPDPQACFFETVLGQALDLLVHASFVHLCTSTLCLSPYSL